MSPFDVKMRANLEAGNATEVLSGNIPVDD
jgi:hypothetical protein